MYKKEEKKQPAEQEEKAAGEDLRKSISGLAWKKDGTVITKALVGDEVTLCANTHNIADGTSATIKIVEKDADGNDDDVATLKAAVQNNTIECAWKVVYTADDDDADSKKELEEKGPMICFHDTQGFNVDAKEIKIKNGVFSCKLVFDFYDHFGLDSEDIKKFGYSPLVDRGFQAWYILQHLNECETGCKAFVDHAKHEEWVEIKIE